MPIEQAIYGSQDVGGYRFLARSAGFIEEWLPAGERLCTGFGERPAGVSCPLAVFAQPIDSRHVAVVQVADQGHDDAGRPGALAFRLLVLPRTLYRDLDGDLFRIAEAFPAPWQARGELPALEWTAGPPALRSVAHIRKILDVAKERTALLLGGAQILVDGGRVAIRRSAPDPDLARDLWDLLPGSARLEIWPTSFAFGNKHRFHVAIVPDAAADDFANYVPEAGAGDYPEGHYETALQHAAEVSNQAELDALFARPSRWQRFKMVLVLMGLFALIPIVLQIPLGKAPPEQPDNGEVEKPNEEKPAQGIARLPDEPTLSAEAPERRELRDELNKLWRQLRPGNEPTEPGRDDASIVAMIVQLDRAIDAKMGAEAPRRKPGDLAAIKEPRRCLRMLLWKHGDADYAKRLNTRELIEHLKARLVAAKLISGEGHE